MELISREQLKCNIKLRFCDGGDNVRGIKCRACLVQECLDEVDDIPAEKQEESK